MFFAVTAKHVAQFTWNLHSSDIFIDRENKYLSFVLLLGVLSLCAKVGLPLSRLQSHAYTDFHEIWKKYSWYKR